MRYALPCPPTAALAALLFSAFAASFASAGNLLPNGNFEMGNAGFTSTAAYVPSGVISWGQYAIRTSAASAAPIFCQSDHTSGSGKFLICDGIAGSPTIAWRSQASVCAGKSYQFSAWLNNVLCSLNMDDPLLELRADGVALTPALVLPESPNAWVHRTGTFTATGPTVLLEIVSLSLSGNGNDFAIDDVTLEPVGSNLVANGDFELGNVGFGSAATFKAAGPLTWGEYSIRTDAGTLGNDTCGTDHTSGSGNFLVCDGFGGTETVAWTSTVAVSPGHKYSFRAFVSNVLCDLNMADPILQLRVGGIPLTTPVTLPESPNEWIAIGGSFTPSASSVLLEIVTLSTAGDGNDFGVDDVVLDCLERVCAADFGFASGGGTLSVCGDDLTLAGSSATLELSGSVPFATALLFAGVASNPTPVPGGTLLPFPAALVLPLPLNGAGALSFPVPGGAGAPLPVYLQAAVPNGSGSALLSNAVGVLIGT